MLIDYQSLSPEALRGIAQQYVQSNISDSDAELDVAGWTEQVISMVKNGELLIEYSEVNDSVYLKSPEQIVQISESNV